ncbi:hypothetical protein [Chromobacterium sp. LK1]|uniref:hypothetical protein n=1 Tax=Chromobacterium sp. LK1 TaxID=1628193 RepID=UPI000ADB92A0|nr:hypothetical protein [Chromobacterium sp. LK1]
MQLIKCTIGVVMMGSSYAIANPSVDIVNSCYQRGAVSNGIKKVDIEGTFVDKPSAGCEDQLEANFEGETYGAATCNDNQYLIVANKMFLASQAINLSIDKRIRPGDDFSATRSVWLAFSKGNESYVCMLRTAFEMGKGRGYAAFYLMKHRPAPAKPEVYFYFLDKVDWSK